MIPEPAWLASRPNATFSATVRDSHSSMIWKVRPRPARARWCGLCPVSDSPLSDTVPFTGLFRPLHALKVVVLPAPLGPISPVTCPQRCVQVDVTDRHQSAEANLQPAYLEACPP